MGQKLFRSVDEESWASISKLSSEWAEKKIMYEWGNLHWWALWLWWQESVHLPTIRQWSEQDVSALRQWIPSDKLESCSSPPRAFSQGTCTWNLKLYTSDFQSNTFVNNEILHFLQVCRRKIIDINYKFFIRKGISSSWKKGHRIYLRISLTKTCSNALTFSIESANPKKQMLVLFAVSPSWTIIPPGAGKKHEMALTSI